jgi:hypothetical protein
MQDTNLKVRRSSTLNQEEKVFVRNEMVRKIAGKMAQLKHKNGKPYKALQAQLDALAPNEKLTQAEMDMLPEIYPQYKWSEKEEDRELPTKIEEGPLSKFPTWNQP